MVVVFPAPLWPSSTVIWPLYMFRSSLFTATLFSLENTCTNNSKGYQVCICVSVFLCPLNWLDHVNWSSYLWARNTCASLHLWVKATKLPTTNDKQAAIKSHYLSEPFDLNTCWYSFGVLLKEHGVLDWRRHWFLHLLHTPAQPVWPLRINGIEGLISKGYYCISFINCTIRRKNNLVIGWSVY